MSDQQNQMTWTAFVFKDCLAANYVSIFSSHLPHSYSSQIRHSSFDAFLSLHFEQGAMAEVLLFE